MSVLGVKAAAREIGVSHSTVSRYLKRYPELNCGTEEQPAVDLDELRRHRGENIHVVTTEPVPAPANSVRPPSSDPGVDPDLPSYNKEKARREKANATTAELNLAERLGQVVPRDEVESTGFDVAQALREALARRNQELSERLAAMNDPSAIAALLDQEDRTLLITFAEQLQALASGDGSDNAAAA